MRSKQRRVVDARLAARRLDARPPPAESARAIGSADIIVVSGGNPLFAIRRWRRLGVDNLLRDAMENGTVLCGGSCVGCAAVSSAVWCFAARRDLPRQWQ